MSNLSRTSISTFITRILLFIDTALWPNDHKADSSTYTFYQYKAFPSELKRSEIERWVTLQVKLLNPFQTSHYYTFVSSYGVHIWFSKTELNGIPETALQNKLKDGSHSVTSRQFSYKQIWQNGVMTSCVVLPNKPSNDDVNSKSTIDFLGTAWATQRKIDNVITSPFSWACAASFIFLMVVIWVSISHISYSVQNSQLENSVNKTSSALSDKLSQESQLRDSIKVLETLPVWRNEFSSFPEVYGLIANSLLTNGVFTPNNIRWQNKSFELEFQSDNINLPNLISSLESNSVVQSVNIRPHNDENTWIIEVTVR